MNRNDAELTLLRERAKQLAQPLGENDAENGVEIVAFQLAGERYGLETEHLREVFAAREITPLPCTPAWVSGIINVRGRILTVVDLRPVLGLPIEQDSASSVLILRGEANDGSGDMALLVQNIDGVRVLSASDIEPPHAVGGALYVRGITSGRLALLDAAQILNDPQLTVQDD